MKILLYMNKEYIFPTNYEMYIDNFSKMSGNMGNKIFYMAIYNMLNTAYNELYFCELDRNLNIMNYTTEEINDRFETVVVVGFLIDRNPDMGGLGPYINALSGIKIPIHVFSAAVNLGSKDELSKLCVYTEKQFNKMKKLILENGGSVATRGEFTQEYFERMGMPEAVMTGCPSLYQNGRDLKVVKKDVDRKKFNFIVCGNKELLKRNKNIFHEYPNSVYIDQDQYASILYGSKNKIEKVSGYCEFLKYLKEYTEEGFSLLCEDRLCLIGDYYAWKQFLTDNEFTFSLGFRIHGNIMSMLSGIPGYVLWHDTRTEEIVNFFKIPGMEYGKVKNLDPYEIFCKTDYTIFNREYSSKFDFFEKYMLKLGLVKDRISISCDKRLLVYQNFREYINRDNIDAIRRCQYLYENRYQKLNSFVEWYWEEYRQTVVALSRLKHKLGRCIS